MKRGKRGCGDPDHLQALPRVGAMPELVRLSPGHDDVQPIEPQLLGGELGYDQMGVVDRIEGPAEYADAHPQRLPSLPARCSGQVDWKLGASGRVARKYPQISVTSSA